MSLAPYLNERNVVSNVNIPEVFFSHPDREVNPIPSAPQKTIFFKNTDSNFTQEVQVNMFENAGLPNTNELVQMGGKSKSYYEEFMIEKKRSMELMREIEVLQNSMKNVKLELAKEGKNNWKNHVENNERKQYEEMIRDLTTKNSKLSEIIKNIEFNPNQTRIIESGEVGN